MRILLASMDPFLARDVAYVLGNQSFTPEHAADHNEALRLVRLEHFDAVVFGTGVAGRPGVDFIRGLRASGSSLPAVAIGTALDGRGRGRLLDAGADDVLDMPCDTMELCARVRAVVRRARGFVRASLGVGTVELQLDTRSATVRGQNLHLSPSEYKVLELLVMRKGTVVSKPALMDMLYGEFDEPDVKSLNVLMHRLRKRLATMGEGNLVRTVWGTGYMVEEAARPLAPLAVPAALREVQMAAGD
jgi:two-component system cell cycle response regulator CtrA